MSGFVSRGARRRPYFGHFAARLFALAVFALALHAGVVNAAAQCVPVNNTGWARGATVRYFLNANLSGEQRRQIRWAVAEWNRANSVNNSRVRFVEDPAGGELQFLNGTLNPGTPGLVRTTFDPTTRTVTSATLTLDPNATFGGTSIPIADPSQPGYDTFIIKVVLHEMGHTMGLEHPAVPNNDACAQPDRATVMNYICGTNDFTDNMPLKVTDCDQSAINSQARYPPFTQFPNPIDQSTTFVRQHYLDFLGREPDQAGLDFWTRGIESCGADQSCRQAKRVDTSAAFFLSIEFQETGYFVYRVYQAAFGDLAGNKPVPITVQEFLPEQQVVSSGVVVGVGDWQGRLEANKNALVNDLVARARFTSRYANFGPTQFVDALNQNAGFPLSAEERDALIRDLTNAGNSTAARAAVLRRVAEDPDLVRNETNAAFVLMQYFGYLRRNPDDTDFQGNQDPQFLGYNFWLSKLNSFNGNYVEAELVRAFIESIEYRRRFGQ